MKRLPLAEFPAAYRAAVLSLLAASRFAHPSRWRDAIVVCTPERREVVHRLEFAAELRGAEQLEDAHELVHAELRSGEVLAYVLRDDAQGCAYACAVLVLPSWRPRR
jgi:hypothetical protein